MSTEINPTGNTPNPANNGGDGGDNGEKLFSQADMDALAGKVRGEVTEKMKAEQSQAIQDAVAKAIAEEQRKASLSEKELKTELEKQREADLNARDENSTLRENELDARDAFEELGYAKSSRLAKIVVNVDKAKMAESITALDEVIKEVAEELVDDRLAGKTPSDLGSGKGANPTKPTSVETEI